MRKERELRKLTNHDLQTMRLPQRFWQASFDHIVSDESREGSPKRLIGGYLSNIRKMREMGAGIVMWGPNGTGKTSMGSLILKEARRHMFTALFLEAASIKTMVVSKEMHDSEAGVTLWARAKQVDFLLLDDLGKGAHDSQGFGERLIDELIRARYANMRPTLITTNVDKTRLGEIIKPSTLHTIKGSCAQVKVDEHDYRAHEGRAIRDILTGGGR